MLKGRLTWAFQFGRDPLRENLAELDSPLIEGIDPPDRSLHENLVLIEGDQFAKGRRREPIQDECVRGVIAVERAVGHLERGDSIRLDFRGGLAEGEGL